MSFLTQELLRELIEYSPDTGVFVWRRRDGARPEWNNRYAGHVAGYFRPDGYVILSFYKQRYLAHRVAWLYVHGHWPADEIDHADGDPSNNRLANLREATAQQNNRNRAPNRTTGSGIKGVGWYRVTKRWMAQIKVNRKKIWLGYHVRFEDAVAARRAAEARYFGEFVRSAA